MSRPFFPRKRRSSQKPSSPILPTYQLSPNPFNQSDRERQRTAAVTSLSILPSIPQNFAGEEENAPSTAAASPQKDETHVDAIDQSMGAKRMNQRDIRRFATLMRSKTQGNAIDDLQSKFTPAKSSRVWDRYVKKAEEEDRDLVEDWDRVIDVTLVFAALFSSMTTGFVLESSKNLQFDPNKATVSAILNLTNIIQTGSATAGAEVPPTNMITMDILDDSFQPTNPTVWVNCLWFLSLGLSISVSLFAMLAKRWTYVFRVKSRSFGTAYERAIKRQESWDAIKKWKMELVIEQLPTLMHIALLLFFIGLVIYLSEIHKPTMIVIATLVAAVAAVYWALTVFPTWFPTCPMVTPFTRAAGALNSFLSQLLHPASLRETIQSRSKRLRRAFVWLFGVVRRRVLEISSHLILWLTNRQSEATSGGIQPSPVAERQQLKSRTLSLDSQEHRHAFRALFWMLCNCKDKKSVKEVLDHLSNFPEVIIDSDASSKQLYEAIVKVAEHSNRLQLENDEPSMDSSRFEVLCGKLIHLAKKEWLHSPESLDPDTGFYRERIEELSEKYPQLVHPNELEEHLKNTQERMLKRSPDYIWCIELFAGRQMFNSSPEDGLKMCGDLGKIVLGLGVDLRVSSSEPKPHDHDLTAKAHSTLWWIFLINALDCTGPSWLRSHLQDDNITIDRVLIWSHLRDSRTREENAAWLTVMGISGILRAFVQYPNHADGPAIDCNRKFFTKIIQILRTVLFSTLVTASSDPFKVTLPVYHKAEVRFYEFDSLRYACDALQCVWREDIYSAFYGDLLNTLKAFRTVEEMKTTMDSWHKEDLEFGCVEKHYQNIINDSLPPSIWFASGLLRCISTRHLDSKRSKFLSKLIPDILFCPGLPDTLKPAYYRGASTESSISREKYTGDIHYIADLVWMPFGCDSHAPKLRAALQGTKINHMRYNRLWDLLTMLRNDSGVLRTEDCPSSPNFQANNTCSMPSSSWDTRALGWCLYIKAGIVDKLYSLRESGDCSIDVLGWSILLAKHFAALLEYWDHANMNPYEELYVITSLMNLVDTLLVAVDPPGISTNQDRITHVDRTAAGGQLELLVKSGVLKVLSRPFSESFSPISNRERDPGRSAFYSELARIIDRLSRDFTTQALNNENSAPPYEGLVTYYERRNSVDSTQMLRLVEGLREYMVEQRV